MNGIYIDNIYFDIIIKRKRIRNIYLRVDNNTIKVNVPYYVSNENIESFILDRQDWILNTYKKISKQTDYKYHGGNYFYFFGKKYTCVYKIGKNSIEIDDDVITISHNNLSNDRLIKMVYKYFDSYLLKNAYICLNRYLCILEDHGLYNVPKLEAKCTKSRWGACFCNKNLICLSSYLIHYPLNCLDYIIVHELSHFIVSNHSKRFYGVVSEYMPDYKEAIRCLKS